jgi:hypothetical protein
MGDWLQESSFKQKTPNAQHSTPNVQLGKNWDYPITQRISVDPESNMQGPCPSALMIRLPHESLIGALSRSHACEEISRGRVSWRAL